MRNASPLWRHDLAPGIHPGAFVQPAPPDTTQVQDGVLWIDTSTVEPYALKCWDQGAGLWRLVGATAPGAQSDVWPFVCLVFGSHGASICNDATDVVHVNTPGAQHGLDDTGYTLPGGHRLEVVPP